MVPPVQHVVPPLQPIMPQIPPVQPAILEAGPALPLFNWSHFKPEFQGKEYGDAETPVIITNYCMDSRVFPDGVKVKRFCLALVG